MASDGSLLEREDELVQFGSLIGDVESGNGRLCVIEGPAGIGKTRLLENIRAEAQMRSLAVLSASGGELERDFAFGVARGLFEEPLRALPGARRSAALDGAAALAAPAIGISDAVAAPGRDPLFPILHGLYWLTGNLAADGPLLLAIDDAHWADEQTLRFVDYLARRIEGVAVLVVLTLRPAEPGAPAALLDGIKDHPATTVLHPRPLSEEATGRLVEGGLGDSPAPEFVRACHAACNGNPFILRELVRTLDADGIAPDDAGADRVPGSHPDAVSRSVLARVGRLPDAATPLARAAAVLGPNTRLADAASLAGVELADATGAVDALVAADILAADGGLGFVHPLVRETIYQDIPPASRLDMHSRAADLLLGATPEPEQIATHLLNCDPGGRAPAVTTLRTAAARAGARGAAETATRYLIRALREPPADDQRGALLQELGSAEARLGREEAIEHLTEAFELAGNAGESAERARELALALTALNRFGEAIEAIGRGIAAVGGDDRELSLLLEGELGALAQLDVSVAARLGDRLHDLAENLTGASAGERLVLASYAHERSIQMAPQPELEDLVVRAIGEGRLLHDQTADSPIVYLLVYAMYRAERGDLVERTLAEAIEEARGRGSLLGTTTALTVRSHMRWLHGALAEADADARSAMEAQVTAGWPAAPLAVAMAAECLLESGEAAAAVALFDETNLNGPMPDLVIFRWALATRGRVRIAAGELDAGIADLLDCESAGMGPRASIGMLWRSNAALGFLAKGDAARAGELAAEELALTLEAGVARPIGVAQRNLGLIEGGRTGLDRIAESIAMLETSGAKLEHARSVVELGAALRRDNQRADARECLKEGLELAYGCGSQILIAQAQDELAIAGAKPRRQAFSGIDSLTPSERRIAGMAGDGMNNPAIAQALFVTRKTVEMHLSNAYRKLDISGRSELPAALVDTEPVE